MQKKYMRRMTIDEIIDYLRQGESKTVTQAVTVISPTINYMVIGLQHQSDKYKKMKDMSQEVKFYKTALSQMQQNKPLIQLPEDCGPLKNLIQFYKGNRSKINQYGDGTNKNKPSFWQKLQKCIDVAHKSKTDNSKTRPQTPPKNKAANLNRTSSIINRELSELQIKSIKQLQSLLIRPDIQYKDYKRKEQQFQQSCGVPCDILDVIQHENKKWYNVCQSLAKNVYREQISTNDIEGETLADKCLLMTQEINKLIRDKSNQLHEEMKTGAEVFNTNIVSLFNIYKRWNERKQSQSTKLVNQIYNQNEKTKQGQDKAKIQRLRSQNHALSKFDKKSQRKNPLDKFMVDLFGSQGKKKQTTVSEYQNRIRQLQYQLKAMDEVKETLRAQHKQALDVQAAEIQRLNNQLKDFSFQRKQLIKTRREYETLKQKYDQAVETSKEWMDEFTKSNKKVKQLEDSLQRSKQNQTFFENLALQNYSNQQISQVAQDEIERIFSKLFEVYTKSKPQISQDISPDDNIERKREFIAMMLKLTKGQRYSQSSQKESIKIEKREEAQLKKKEIKFNKSQTKPIKIGRPETIEYGTNTAELQRDKEQQESKDVNDDKLPEKPIKVEPQIVHGTVEIKIESKDEKVSDRKGFLQVPRDDHQERSNSNRKTDKTVKQLREQNERLKESIKTLKKRCQSGPTENTYEGNQSKSKETPLTESESLKALVELRDLRRKFKESTQREEQMKKRNEMLQQESSSRADQLAVQKANVQTCQTAISSLKQQIRTLKQEVQTFRKHIEDEMEKNKIKKEGKLKIQHQAIQVQIVLEQKKPQEKKEQLIQSEKQLQEQQKDEQPEQVKEPQPIPQQKEQQIKLAQEVQNLKKDLKQKEERIAELQTQLSQLEQQLKKTETLIKEKQDLNQKLEQEIKEKSKIIKKEEANLEEKKKEQKTLTDNISKLKTSLASLEKMKNEEEAPKQKEEKKKDEKKDEVKEIKEEMKIMLERKQKMEKQCLAVQKNCTQLRTKQTKLTTSLTQLETRIAQLTQQQQQTKSLISETETYSQQKLSLQKQLSQLTTKLTQQKTQQVQMEKEVKEYNSKMGYLKLVKDQYASQRVKLDKVKKEAGELEKKVDEGRREIQGMKEDRRKREEELKKVENAANQKAEQMKKRLQNLKNQTQQSQKHLATVQASLKQKINQNLRYGGFNNRHFIGDSLTEQSDRDYLITQLQSLHKGKQIQKTKLLYTFPLMKDINPHVCIDGVPNYVIIIRSARLTKDEKNYVLALYSERPLAPVKEINQGLGFISAVSSRRTFFLKRGQMNNPRVTEYNQYFFVFGNSEVRLRFRSNILEFNIGHLYKSYDTGSIKTPEVFTGHSESESELLNYEVYQVIFKGEKEKEKVFVFEK